MTVFHGIHEGSAMLSIASPLKDGEDCGPRQALPSTSTWLSGGKMGLYDGEPSLIG